MQLTNRPLTKIEEEEYFAVANKYISRIRDEKMKEEVKRKFLSSTLYKDGLNNDTVNTQTTKYLKSWVKARHMTGIVRFVEKEVLEEKTTVDILVEIIAVVSNPLYFCFYESKYDSTAAADDRDKRYCYMLPIVLENTKKFLEEEERKIRELETKLAEMKQNLETKNQWVELAENADREHQATCLRAQRKSEVKQKRKARRDAEMQMEHFTENSFTDTVNIMDQIAVDNERSRQDYNNTQDILNAAYCMFF